ncbi:MULTISPECIES: winged helix-turn-helix transcriptional regulator [Chryseobacterium]|uniref:winged helix-turn-helix transcriptional regulator n=1 Tax=Chryseobacterium TaxID=59732 RepID=UPI00063D3A65|nr:MULTISPECIES: helix-turn-helix domain-containing protein [Chryseobacterium]PZU83312.1 MAG: transcriptional regulator [Chryseobacterium sp.]UMQ41675.1 helix-turn-helix transcriptional regulator [Chryseobacterium sp. Y16C]
MARVTDGTEQKTCMEIMLPIQDALEILKGKWKLPIIVSLSFGSKRFRELAREIPKITDRVLSKELKELETNHLITRTVHETFPPTVEYEITDHGLSLEKVIMSLKDWGLVHRKKVTEK